MMKSLKVQKFKNFCLAALLIASATFTACSSSDDNIVEEQPANPAQHTYTMTIEATKGGDAATTRALALDGKALNATWQTTDEVAVYNYTQQATLGGHLSPQSDGASATLTGSLTGSVAVDDIIFLRWPLVDADYTGQDGKLETIAQRYDYTTGVAKVKAISGAAIVAEDSSPSGGVLFTNNQAIVKFTLIDKATAKPINATQLTIDAKFNGESRLIQSITYPNTYTLGPITIDRTEPDDNVVYAALPFSSQAKFTFALTATDGTHNYTYEKADVTMINGRYYEVTVKMTRKTYPITLSEVTSDYLGSVVTTDGTVYATVADASAANKTAAGMIAYVSGIGQGLVIALADETSAMNWNTAITTAAAHTAVTGYSWKLPSQDEWNQMFSANGGSEGSYTGLNTALAAAGGNSSKLQDDIYWSSTPYDEANAWRVHLFEGTTNWNTLGKGINIQVRACLAFGPARGHALASSAVGEIVGSDGLAYYASDKNNLPLGVTAVAMVAYKNGNNGLAIALADEGRILWHDATSTCEGKAAIGSYSWKFPSQAEWQQMFSANGGDASSYSGLNSAISTAGGTALKEDYYWSSSTVSGNVDYAYRVHLKDGSASWISQYKGWTEYVRACFAFGPAGGHALTSSAVGEIVGSDGLAYYASDKNDLPSGVTAVAMVAYVGDASDCTHGLAIALADERGSMDWNTAKSTCEGKTAVTGGTWRLPSAKDWQYMFIGCGSGETYSDPSSGMSRSYSGLASKLTIAGGTAFKWNEYCSSSVDLPSNKVWDLFFVDDSNARFYFANEDVGYFVRACLAF